MIQGKKLRKILEKCFRPNKVVEYDKVRYILNKILDDEFIYSVEKIEPTCEHIVPKKQYSGDSPYVSDIHNLYLAANQINVLRDTKKFYKFNPDEKTKKYFGNRYSDTYFEPIDQSKGVIARSCAYFYTVYPELFGSITEVIDIDVLKEWGLYKPSISEHNRNLFVYQLQHNINPYIVYPRLIQHAFFDVDSKQLELASAERELALCSKYIEDSILKTENALLQYIKHNPDSFKSSYGALRFEELKKILLKFNGFWL